MARIGHGEGHEIGEKSEELTVVAWPEMRLWRRSAARRDVVDGSLVGGDGAALVHMRALQGTKRRRGATAAAWLQGKGARVTTETPSTSVPWAWKRPGPS